MSPSNTDLDQQRQELSLSSHPSDHSSNESSMSIKEQGKVNSNDLDQSQQQQADKLAPPKLYPSGENMLFQNNNGTEGSAPNKEDLVNVSASLLSDSVLIPTASHQTNGIDSNSKAYYAVSTAELTTMSGSNSSSCNSRAEPYLSREQNQHQQYQDQHNEGKDNAKIRTLKSTTKEEFLIRENNLDQLHNRYPQQSREDPHFYLHSNDLRGNINVPSSSPPSSTNFNHKGGERHRHEQILHDRDESSEDNGQEGRNLMDGDQSMDHGHYRENYSSTLSDEKYKRLKRKLREVLEENERMSKELDKSQRRVRNLRREKLLLLDRLCLFERKDSGSGSDSLSSLSSDSEEYESSTQEDIPPEPVKLSIPAGKQNKAKSNSKLTPNPNATPTPGTTPQHPKKSATAKNTPGASTGGRAGSAKETKSHSSVSTPSTITNVGSATQKPKRIHQINKLRPGLGKVRRVQAVEKDENGNVKLPVTVGIITIQSLGHVVYDREAFHNDRYIWPVGYKMSRSYNSMIDPNNQTTYTCSVIDDGEAPKFQIDAEDQPGKPIIAGSATGAWTHVVKAANAIRKRDHSNSASGPDYYGFSNATIAKMIQDLPNVDKCESYIMQRFEEPASTRSSGNKASTAAITKGPNDHETNHHKHGGIHDGDNDDDNDDAYTSLGTPGRKKARISSPKIRHAGLDYPASVLEQKRDDQTEQDELIEDVDDGDETQSEHEQEERRRPLTSPKPNWSVSIHSTTIPCNVNQHSAPSVVTTAGESIVDIEGDGEGQVDSNFESDVIVDVDGDVSMHDSASPLPGEVVKAEMGGSYKEGSEHVATIESSEL
ncbi:hypothetical protein BX616_001489 [Lobosporangium transversale]|uniref:INO80 complex subunit E N-terminal domain-containing protein n=1 Tax=Lobosporangium transversale TaxID=64571 RepID=A0A1Y2GHN5_9FUNG|nr:hypothetical protein BCR41DRAFT_423514 [Lobosporangium transversale]KAF9917281.1 hypothetical protein BX616_001489 [Lobosporangium transversale]ORZ11290.1 hypothetical protein BCR41DRAFT_423514 [Lobosporangium transversale]|eukprot:XP_021879605.1 hypothetical protein BCR41DRAFT_423514 [Lobosporangium transversale]